MRVVLVVLWGAVALSWSNPIHASSCGSLIEEHFFRCVDGHCEHKDALERRASWGRCSRYTAPMALDSSRRVWMESLLRLMGPPETDGDYRFVLHRYGGGKLTWLDATLQLRTEIDVSGGFDSLEPAIRSDLRDYLLYRDYTRMLLPLGDLSFDEYVSERIRDGRWSYWQDFGKIVFLQGPILLVLLWLCLQGARVHFRIFTRTHYGALVRSQMLGVFAVLAYGLCWVWVDEDTLFSSVPVAILGIILLCWQGLLAFAHWLWVCARRTVEP